MLSPLSMILLYTFLTVLRTKYKKTIVSILANFVILIYRKKVTQMRGYFVYIVERFCFYRVFCVYVFLTVLEGESKMDLSHNCKKLFDIFSI